jgi:hypothetical protein
MTDQTPLHGEITCALSLQWTARGPVVLDEAGRLRFPASDSLPGVYRLAACCPNGRRATYIGESDNLRRRFGNYRNPGLTQQTSQRIHRWLLELLAVGGDVTLSVAERVRINSVNVDLSRKAVRCMFEQMAVVLEHAEDVESINR